jgi:hypothetical protein
MSPYIQHVSNDTLDLGAYPALLANGQCQQTNPSHGVSSAARLNHSFVVTNLYNTRYTRCVPTRLLVFTLYYTS